MTSLKEKTFKGSIWSLMQQFGTTFISFLSNIVLARLLTPDDYGCIGMLAIFILISNIFINGGFGSALIQKKKPTQVDYSTVFWFNLFLAIFLYWVLFISAPYISSFYRMPLLQDVLRVQGVVLILNALSIVQTNRLRKQLEMKLLTNINLISVVVATLVTILLAWKGWGVWALIAQNLVLSFLSGLLLWITNRWRPIFCFSFDSLKQLFGFGGNLLAVNLMATFCNNIQGVLIGRFFTPAMMGYYSQSRKLESLATHTISTAVSQVSFPVMSQFQHDNVKMQNAFCKFITLLAYVTMPLMSILILTAKPLILLIYGEKWLQCVPYFQILCVSGFIACLQETYFNTIAGKGNSRILLLRTIFVRAISLVILVISMKFWGIYGLLWGSVAGSWILWIANVYLIKRCISYSIMQQIRDLIPIASLTIVAFLLVFILSKLFSFNIYIDAVIELVLYIIVYILFSFIFKNKTFYFLLDLLKGCRKP